MDKERWCKTLLGVAPLAGSFVRSSGELATMRICMAVGTTLEFCDCKTLDRLAVCRGSGRDMTLLAPDGCVFSPQKESRGGMVECSGRSLFPSARGMATLAGLLKFACMGIGVAGGTGWVTEADKPDACNIGVHPGMTACALDLGMFPREAEFRGIVWKTGRGFPGVGGMALLTLGGELSAVRVVVASFAFPWKAQVGVSVAEFAVAQDFLCLDEFPGMAGCTLLLAMLSLEGKTDPGVIECPGIESCEREVLAVMFLVTFHAPAWREGAMIAGACSDTGANFGVAGETFVVRDGLAKFVTWGAVADSLERSMRCRQFSGRDLGDGSLQDRQTCEGEQSAVGPRTLHHTHQ
jgi:hypothetical protein